MYIYNNIYIYIACLTGSIFIKLIKDLHQNHILTSFRLVSDILNDLIYLEICIHPYLLVMSFSPASYL